MRKLVRCYRHLKRELQRTDTHVHRNSEMNVQMETKLASAAVEGAAIGTSPPGRVSLSVDENYV